MIFLMSSVQQRRISLAVLICQASVSKAEAFFLTALCGLTSNVLQFCWTTGCAFGWFMGVRYGSAVLLLNSWVYWVRLRALFSMKDSFPITQWADPHCARELNDIDFVEADVEADTSFCRVCHATSQTPGNVPGLASMKMVTKSKCWFCHATHLLAYGDTTWKDCSTSVLWINFLANIRVLDIPNPNIPRHDSWISFFAEGDVFFVVVVLILDYGLISDSYDES